MHRADDDRNVQATVLPPAREHRKLERDSLPLREDHLKKQTA